MIRLAVQEYCQACSAFQPMVMESVQTDEGGDERKVYEVRCERWELCANVARMSRGMSMEAGRRNEPHQSPVGDSFPKGEASREKSGHGNVVSIGGIVAEVR